MQKSSSNEFNIKRVPWDFWVIAAVMTLLFAAIMSVLFVGFSGRDSYQGLAVIFFVGLYAETKCFQLIYQAGLGDSPFSMPLSARQ